LFLFCCCALSLRGARVMGHSSRCVCGRRQQRARGRARACAARHTHSVARGAGDMRSPQPASPAKAPVVHSAVPRRRDEPVGVAARQRARGQQTRDAGGLPVC
jgi:hypothetical protein